jgi:hypothetical protein
MRTSSDAGIASPSSSAVVRRDPRPWLSSWLSATPHRQETLNPKVQGSTLCASTINGGFEFKSTPYLGVADAMCHAQPLFDSLTDSLTNSCSALERRWTVPILNSAKALGPRARKSQSPRTPAYAKYSRRSVGASASAARNGAWLITSRCAAETDRRVAS